MILRKGTPWRENDASSTHHAARWEAEREAFFQQKKNAPALPWDGKKGILKIKQNLSAGTLTTTVRNGRSPNRIRSEFSWS